jgi:hypothetical protein
VLPGEEPDLPHDRPIHHLKLDATRLPGLWLGALVLAAFLVWRWHGYSAAVDLNPVDEFFYLDAGRKFLRGESLPTMAWAPVYSVLLALLHEALPPDVWCFDTMSLLARICLALACWWAFFPVLGVPFALLMGAWLASLDAVTSDTVAGASAIGNVYVVGFAFCAVTCGLWLRGKQGAASLLAICLCLIRGEYAIWFAVLAVTGWRGLRAKSAGLRLGVAAIAGALFALTTMAPSAKDRSWLAFQQHYGRHAMETRLVAQHGSIENMTPAQILDAAEKIGRAFVHPDAIVAEDFDGAISLTQAMWRSPLRYSAYVAHNVVLAARSIDGVVVPKKFGGRMLAILVGIAALFGVFVLLVRARGGCGLHARLAGCGGAGIVALLPSLAMTGLRGELALPFAMVVVCVGLLGVSAALARVTMREGSGWTSWTAAVAGILALACLGGAPYQDAGSQPTPLRDTLACMQSLDAATGRTLVATNALYPFHVVGSVDGVSCVGIGDLGGFAPGSVPTSLAAARMDAVVMDCALAFELRNQPEALAALQGSDWQVVKRVGQSVVYRRATKQFPRVNSSGS